MKYLAILLVLFSSSVMATELSDWHILNVNSVYLDGMVLPHAFEPFLAPTYQPKTRIDLHVDLDLLNGWLFFNNMVHAETDDSQYRLIGWNYRVGIHLGRSADFFMEHFSQHLLDYVPAMSNTYDAIGIRIYFYRKDEK